MGGGEEQAQLGVGSVKASTADPDMGLLQSLPVDTRVAPLQMPGPSIPSPEETPKASCGSCRIVVVPFWHH